MGKRDSKLYPQFHRLAVQRFHRVQYVQIIVSWFYVCRDIVVVRRDYCVERFQKSMCVRPSVCPVHAVRPIKKGSILVIINQVFAMVIPSRVTHPISCH